MNSRQNTTAMLFVLVAMVGFGTGCGITVEVQNPPPSIPPEAPGVTVNGLVNDPSVLPVPTDRGLTLLSALQRAGGPSIARPKDDDTVLVRVRKNYDFYYFPLFLVESQVVGDVILTGGEEVAVVLVSDTPFYLDPSVDITKLVSDLPDSNRVVTVKGFVERPADYQLPKGLGDIDPITMTLSIGRNAGGANPSDVSTVLVWSRGDVEGLRNHHWFLPRSAFGRTKYLDNVDKSVAINRPGSKRTILPGDIVDFTELKRQKFVLRGILARDFQTVINRARARERQRRLAQQTRRFWPFSQIHDEIKKLKTIRINRPANPEPIKD